MNGRGPRATHDCHRATARGGTRRLVITGGTTCETRDCGEPATELNVLGR